MSTEDTLRLGGELGAYAAQAEAQKSEAERLVRDLTDEQFRWRPRPEKWSIGEHLVHLPKTSRPYLAALDAALADARAGGLLGPGPYRYGWLGNWFVRTMEPPPRMKLPTLKALEPVVVEEKTAVLRDFLAVQDEVLASLRAAHGVDLGRAKIRSPFFRLLRLSVGQAYGVLLAHNRRHLWHVANVAADPSLPGRR